MPKKKGTTQALRGKSSTTSATTDSQNVSTNVTSETKESSDMFTDSKENLETKSKKTPPKWQGVRIHNGDKGKKKVAEEKANKISLHVEGYAFHDDIIGITHVRPDGEDVYNLSLCNKIIDNTPEDQGFSSFCMLRDKTSGKDDDYLSGVDGYPKYIFMSIGIHKFDDAKEASSAVLEQCKNLQEVIVSWNMHSNCICISSVSYPHFQTSS